jgi:hypothetical protein
MTNQTHTAKTRRFRPSPALILSCVALFMALTGSALAGGLVAKNSVRSPQIVDGTVRTVDLHDGSVQTTKIAPAAVDQTKIAPNAVGPDQLAENSVSSSKVAQDSLQAQDLAPNSVTSSEVADQSLTEADLGPNSVGSSEIAANAVRADELAPLIEASETVTIKGGANASVSANCPAGSEVISGGSRGGFYQVATSGSYRSGNGWRVDARSSATGDTTLTAYAYCLIGGSSN